MSLSIVTFAQLGSKPNLKTPDIKPVIETFAAEKQLKQIVCFYEKDFSFKNTVTVMPRWLSFALRKLGVSRQGSEAVFDTIASFRLRKANVTLIHPPQFPRTIAAAKRKGSIVLGLVVEAHPLLNRQLQSEEGALLKVEVTERHPWMQSVATAIEQSDYLIAPSDFVKKSYVDAGFPEDKIYVAHFDINAEKFKPSSRPKDEIFRVVYVADTQPLKGLHYLLEAWSILNLKNAELVIAGSLSVPEALKERYLKTIHEHPSISWVGHVSNPGEYYEKASAFVFPSLTEGFSRAIMEAQASGLPVITTENAPGLVVDGVNGFIVPIRDATALAQKIEYLYSHRDHAEVMGQTARHMIETKKSFGKAVYDVYQKILTRHGISLS
jgi:glycosyltransferase involved in cell wall biosynthesis